MAIRPSTFSHFLLASSSVLKRSTQLSHIPTVGGPSAPILSYWSAVNFFRKPKALLREGYERVRRWPKLKR